MDEIGELGAGAGEDSEEEELERKSRNGTVNLRAGSLSPHRQEDQITKLAPVDFIPDAQCPRWLAFLERIMDGNKDLIDHLQRVVGYSLTGDVHEPGLLRMGRNAQDFSGRESQTKDHDP